MPVLDFKEIPEAHKATGFQDTFELFARDFLSLIGYKIISHPNRGADGGADLIVEEKRTGVGGETIVKWLVSWGRSSSRVTSRHFDHGNGTLAFTSKLFRFG